ASASARRSRARPGPQIVGWLGEQPEHILGRLQQIFRIATPPPRPSAHRRLEPTGVALADRSPRVVSALAAIGSSAGGSSWRARRGPSGSMADRARRRSILSRRTAREGPRAAARNVLVLAVR